MTPSQLAACRNRNDQLKQDIAAQAQITMARLKKAVEDIDSLFEELDRKDQRIDFEQKSRKQWQEDVARLKREYAELKRQYHACMHTVNPLRDKISKARDVLNGSEVANDKIPTKFKKYIAVIMRD